ncbi:hypothetical protein GCM10010297_42990 [Streptomyces malachitofuscus]|nr:hypothetical protein GCM10010297_42990 [Streptomyces malachitofuscus]
MGPLFTLRNQGRAESVQITLNLDTRAGPARVSSPTQSLYGEDAQEIDLVPTHATKRTGSQSDHGIATARTAPGRAHLVSRETIEQTFRLRDEPDEVNHVPHTGRRVDSG